MKNANDLFSVKMRSSAGGRHVSGAERIVPRGDVAKTASALVVRALRASPDFLNIKAEKVGEPRRLQALKVVEEVVASPAEGWARAEEILREAGFERTPEIRALFVDTYPMRGAMLLDADSLERLEPDRERGVRATGMDSTPSPSAAVKNHYAEAVALATKVLSAPGIAAEVCVSDDPGYVTGYVAARGVYHRISKLKEPGSALGGRIFLYRGPREAVGETIRYLEDEPVVVEGLAPARPALRADSRFASLEADLAADEAAGLLRAAPVARGPSSNNQTIQHSNTQTIPVVSFASNDYLGLACDERVKRAAAQAALAYGGGSGASRLVSGTTLEHVELERAIARFKGAEDAIVFTAGYMANVGAITAIAGCGDVVLSDELNHASIIDGCRMSGAEVLVYRHLDMEDLERRLSFCPSYRRRLVVSDGVFSMDGDALDLARFMEICRRYDAFSMVDEAHSLGVVGASGRGLCERFGISPGDGPDLMMGTLSKSLGSAGGYVAASRRLVAYLRQRARPYIFSTAPTPAAMAAAHEALNILEAEPQLVSRLMENVAFFRSELGDLAPNGAPESAIVPVVIGDERRAVELSQRLRAQGFEVPAIRYPTVAMGAARLRFAIRADHSRDDLAAAARALRVGWLGG